MPTEWRYAEILSCFNAYMDGDALGLGAMANASFFQHYPLADRYPQNPKPTRESLTARGLLDAQGRIVPRRYVAHYVGDYDAAAWLYRELPRMWRDPARGTTPLSWAFNPCLAMRFPLGMAWARERRTANDWFVAGDSGAGYLNPGYLTPPRPHSGLPSGLAAWEKYCEQLYRQWDLSLTGFVIDGYARGLDKAGLDAYARFSPDGIVAQQIGRQGVHGTMPYLRMATDLHGSPAEAARAIAGLNKGSPPRFTVCRSILQTPSWYAQVEKELQAMPDERIQVVDLYTLLWLVREYETHRDGLRRLAVRSSQGNQRDASEERRADAGFRGGRSSLPRSRTTVRGVGALRGPRRPVLVLRCRRCVLSARLRAAGDRRWSSWTRGLAELCCNTIRPTPRQPWAEPTRAMRPSWIAETPASGGASRSRCRTPASPARKMAVLISASTTAARTCSSVACELPAGEERTIWAEAKPGQALAEPRRGAAEWATRPSAA